MKLRQILLLSFFFIVHAVPSPGAQTGKVVSSNAYDVVVVGGTPGGIMAAIGAVRGGRTVALLERSSHIGGLPANGLGATDIHTRCATEELFLVFVPLQN